MTLEEENQQLREEVARLRAMVEWEGEDRVIGEAEFQEIEGYHLEKLVVEAKVWKLERELKELKDRIKDDNSEAKEEE